MQLIAFATRSGAGRGIGKDDNIWIAADKILYVDDSLYHEGGWSLIGLDGDVQVRVAHPVSEVIQIIQDVWGRQES